MRDKGLLPAGLVDELRTLSPVIARRSAAVVAQTLPAYSPEGRDAEGVAGVELALRFTIRALVDLAARTRDPDAGAHTLVELTTLSGTAAAARERASSLADQGVTELVYQPAGDIERELQAFAAALRIAPGPRASG